MRGPAIITIAGLILIGTEALAWEEQEVLAYIMAHNPLIRAHQDVTREYSPPGPMRRVLEGTSVFARFASGGTASTNVDGSTTTTDPLTFGLQVTIPLASPKEEREWAVQAMGLVQQIEEIRAQVLVEIANLRQTEAELAAASTRLEFFTEKVNWSKERLNRGYDNADVLWEVTQSKMEHSAEADRLQVLLDSQQYRVASYAGNEWQTLLSYLKGNGRLPGVVAEEVAEAR